MICSYWAHACSQWSLLFSVLINPSRWWDNMRKSPPPPTHTHTHTLPSTSMTQRNVSKTFCQQLGPSSHLTLSLFENRAIHQPLSPFCEHLHAMISLTRLILARCLVQVSYFSTLELKELVQSADRTNLQKLSSSSLPLESPNLPK